MLALPLALSLLLTQSAPVPAADTRAPVSGSAQAQSVVSQAFASPSSATPSPTGITPASTGSSAGGGSPWLAALFLAALGGGALMLRRRKAVLPGSTLQIHERVSLGPKKMLALAQWGNELLLLGVTDSGISLLRSQPAPAPQLMEAPALQPQPQHRGVAVAAPITSHGVSGFEDSLQAAMGDESLRGETTEGDALLAKLRAAAVSAR